MVCQNRDVFTLKKKVNFECPDGLSWDPWSHSGDFSSECEKHYTRSLILAGNITSDCGPLGRHSSKDHINDH